MEIQVPEEPVVALFGRDATLRCSFSPEANFSLDDLSLIWQLTDTKRLVHSFSGGRDQLADQGGGYANRTALFYDQLAQGNVSLLLRRVEIADEGSFTCFVRVRDYSSAAVTLQVAGERWRGVPACLPQQEGFSVTLSSSTQPLSPPVWSPHEFSPPTGCISPKMFPTGRLIPSLLWWGGSRLRCRLWQRGQE